MQAGLNLWDTAHAYGMGTSEKVLGEFLRTVFRDSYLISDKFTPQCANSTADNAVIAMYDTSATQLETDYKEGENPCETESTTQNWHRRADDAGTAISNGVPVLGGCGP